VAPPIVFDGVTFILKDNHMVRFADYASDGRKAYPIIAALFDDIIVRLRRDPRIHAVASRDDLELLLADAHRDAEILLVRELRDRVALADLGEDR
jgi:hypothetical protein